MRQTTGTISKQRLYIFSILVIGISYLPTDPLRPGPYPAAQIGEYIHRSKTISVQDGTRGQTHNSTF